MVAGVGVSRLGHPKAGPRAPTVLDSAAFVPWSEDEALRGVKPFRRLVDVAVLARRAFALVRLG